MNILIQQLIWSLCLIGGGLFAQNHQQKKAKKLYENLAYIDALKFYTDLVDKEVKRDKDGVDKCDFTGLMVPDKFLIGYGLDFDGFLRNLPGIYAVDL